jgi:hypothetical protein
MALEEVGSCGDKPVCERPPVTLNVVVILNEKACMESCSAAKKQADRGVRSNGLKESADSSGLTIKPQCRDVASFLIVDCGPGLTLFI